MKWSSLRSGCAAERHKANSFMPLTHSAHDVLENEVWFAEAVR
ncbi:hypothetical protein [Sphaerisporangium album]|nr:hypothetical protein [Sphaerisporangium album]